MAERKGSVPGQQRGRRLVRLPVHDERADVLALNLMHDIVTDRRSVQDARDRYGRECADHRRRKPTPYMDRLRFRPGRGTADPDTRTLSEQELERAAGDGRDEPG